MITHSKIREYYSLENPQSQKYGCETRLDHFVYEEEALRHGLTAVKFYRAYLGIQYSRCVAATHCMLLFLSK